MTNVIPMPEPKQPEATCDAVKDAIAYGYSVHTAVGDDFDKELMGKWWWTLQRSGWIDCVTDPDTHRTEAEAWIAAIAHHKAELMFDEREEPKE